MHIKKVIIKNFRCFENLEVNLDPDINIFVGNNGSGKSALLDAIAAAIYPYVSQIKRIGNKEQEVSPVLQRDLPVKQDGRKRKTQAEFTISTNGSTNFIILTGGVTNWTIVYKKRSTEDDNESINFVFSSLTVPIEEVNSVTFVKELKSSEHEMQNRWDNIHDDIKIKYDLSVIAYYKGDRNLTNIANIESISNKAFDRFDALKNCFDATANFTDLANWFFVREYEELREGKNRKDINFELPDLKQVRNAISTIIAPNARVYFSGATSAKLMVEWTMETGEKREFLLSQLSAGYRNMLALVMDFARRLAQANPQMENPLAAEAILMIDELDLHLHPTWQQKIIPDLKKVFPNTQIIATTHSPEVVTTVKQNQVWILEDYQIKSCPEPTKGRKSSDVVRNILGLSELRPLGLPGTKCSKVNYTK